MSRSRQYRTTTQTLNKNYIINNYEIFTQVCVPRGTMVDISGMRVGMLLSIHM